MMLTAEDVVMKTASPVAARRWCFTPSTDLASQNYQKVMILDSALSLTQGLESLTLTRVFHNELQHATVIYLQTLPKQRG